MNEVCVATSKFISFFDECGDHSLTKINPELPVFLLCTIIVERELYAKKIIPEICAFKLRYFAHEGINLHSRDIRKAQGPFAILQNSNIREKFLNELSELIAELPFTLFVTAIKKNPYAKRYGNSAKNPYDVALEYSFERVLHFMESHGETSLPVIAEARGKNEDNELRASFYQLTSQGTYYNSAKRFRQLICPLTFRRKNDNIVGIQLADLCAYPTARHVLKPNNNNRAFESIVPHFYKGNGTGNRVYGLKIHPK